VCCASLRAVQRVGAQIHGGFQHPQTWLHSKSELNKKSLKLSFVTRAHPCYLLCRCCALLLEKVQDYLCDFSWLLNTGPWAPCWKKGAKDRAGGAGRERDGASLEGAALKTLAKSRSLAWIKEQMYIPGAVFPKDCYNPASTGSCWYG